MAYVDYGVIGSKGVVGLDPVDKKITKDIVTWDKRVFMDF